jgi:hypothetical protein
MSKAPEDSTNPEVKTEKAEASEKAAKSKADKTPETVTLSLSDLRDLIKNTSDTSGTASAEIMAKAIAAAIMEARKPYIDPKKQENDDNMRKSMAEIARRTKVNVERAQQACEHLQGCNELSTRTGDMTCIIKHRLDNGVVVGICTNCGRQFWPKDPDYITHMRRKTSNLTSMAGDRTIGSQFAAVTI